jgi:hypothetical protein
MKDVVAEEQKPLRVWPGGATLGRSRSRTK